MGNGTSAIESRFLDASLLSSPTVVTSTSLYSVSIHHTSQDVYKKYAILKYTQSEESSRVRTLKHCEKANVRSIDLSDLMSKLSLASRFRHPSILQVLMLSVDLPNNAIYVPAEVCIPLDSLLNTFKVLDLLAGICDILQALIFLHNTSLVSHNNLRTTSIFITSKGRWKLGAFEFATLFKDMNTDVIRTIEQLHQDNLKYEIGFAQNYPFAYDLFSFGRMICSFCHDAQFEPMQNFLAVLRTSCMHSNPSLCLSADQLSGHAVFMHPLIEAKQFFINYMVHTDAEKEAFLRSFKKNIADRLPEDILCTRILPSLFQDAVFVDPPTSQVINSMLHPIPDHLRAAEVSEPTNEASPHIKVAPLGPQPDLCTLHHTDSMGGLVSEKAFCAHLASLVVTKFTLRERHTRMILLQHFNGFAHLLGSRLADTVLPEVCLGIFDNFSPLVTLSLQALAELAHLIGPSCVLNALRRTEILLSQSNKSQSATQKHQPRSGFAPTTAAATYGQWPRYHLFAESGPKLDRCYRDVPPDQRTYTAHPSADWADQPPKSRSLSQLAALSNAYDPTIKAKLLQLEADENELGEHIGQVSLHESAVKLASQTQSLPHSHSQPTATAEDLWQHVEHQWDDIVRSGSSTMEANAGWNDQAVPIKSSTEEATSVVHLPTSPQQALLVSRKSTREATIDALLAGMEPTVLPNRFDLIKPASPTPKLVANDDASVNVDPMGLRYVTSEEPVDHSWGDDWEEDLDISVDVPEKIADSI